MKDQMEKNLMNKVLLIITMLFGIHSNMILAMNAPDGWQPNRPSESGRPSRPRPQAINYGTPPKINPNNTPILATPSTTTDDAAMNFFLNPFNEPQVPTSTASQATTPGTVTINPMHIINTGTESISTATAQVRSITPKEIERLQKIKKDLDEIEEVLKEMGFDLAATALSAAGLDPIGAAFSASNSIITIPKLAYYYGNMQKHIFYLSSNKTSPEAKAQLKQLTPRLQVVSKVIAKGPEKLQKLIKKFSKDKPLEAK